MIRRTVVVAASNVQRRRDVTEEYVERELV